MISDPDLAQRFQTVEGLNFEGWTTAAKFKPENYEEVQGGYDVDAGHLFAAIADEVGVPGGFDSAVVRLKGTDQVKYLVFHPVTGSVFLFSDDKAPSVPVGPVVAPRNPNALTMGVWVGGGILAGVLIRRALKLKTPVLPVVLGGAVGVAGAVIGARKGWF